MRIHHSHHLPKVSFLYIYPRPNEQSTLPKVTYQNELHRRNKTKQYKEKKQQKTPGYSPHPKITTHPCLPFQMTKRKPSPLSFFLRISKLPLYLSSFLSSVCSLFLLGLSFQTPKKQPLFLRCMASYSLHAKGFLLF